MILRNTKIVSLHIIISLVIIFSIHQKSYANFPIENVFLQIDTCISDEVKELIISKNESDFSMIGSFGGGLKLYDENIHCFQNIYTLFESDSNFIEYFGELVVDEYDSYIGEIYAIVRKVYHKHLKNLPYDFDQEIDSLRRLKKFVDAQDEMWLTADSINGYYIPKDIDDAIRELNRILDSASIAEIKNYRNEEVASGSEHFGLGHMIRYMWKLGGSRFLHDTGLEEADYISGLVVTAYYRHLNSKPINLDELIEECKKQEAKYHLQNE